jgi:hypothetical protein
MSGNNIVQQEYIGLERGGNKNKEVVRENKAEALPTLSFNRK